MRTRSSECGVREGREVREGSGAARCTGGGSGWAPVRGQRCRCALAQVQPVHMCVCAPLTSAAHSSLSFDGGSSNGGMTREAMRRALEELQVGLLPGDAGLG